MRNTVKIFYKLLFLPFRLVWWTISAPIVLGYWAFDKDGLTIKEVYTEWINDDY